MMKDNYELEACERWGSTEAYKEYSNKKKSKTKEQWTNINDGLMSIFGEFAELKNKGEHSNSNTVQALVIKLQKYITLNYYTCTDEILSGLGQMYTLDERFKENIDRYGEGNSDFVAKSIEIYLKGKKNENN